MDYRLESALLSAIVDTLDDGLAVLDAQGRVLLVNRAFRADSQLPRVEPGDELASAWRADAGAPELISVLERVVRGDASEAAWETVFGPRRVFVTVRGLLGADPARVLVRVVGRNEPPKPAGAPLAVNERLQQLESMERAAGALAHDFNNLLTAVLGSTVSLRSLLERALDDTWSIDRAAGHAAALSRRLRTLSRSDTREPAPADLELIVQELLPMLTAAAGTGVRIEAPRVATPWLVEVDALEMEQVLMNLVINARDAMVEGGVIEIRVENLCGDSSFTRFRDRTERVALHVRDSGQGILPEFVGRVFDPFFTTKAPGRGTGLGLTNVREIVERNHGRVVIHSEPGRGTTVSIYLPRCVAIAAPSVRPFPVSFLRGSEVVLIVEDDYRVRITTARALSERGYKVLTASSADEARRVERECEGNIDLLLTDVGLPGSSGVDLARELVRRRPGMQVLFVSGHAEDVALGPEASEQGLLLKPYRPDELATRVRELLDASAQARVGRELLGA